MGTFEGISAVQSFSPGWGKPEFLEKILVGRKELVDRLEELAIDGAGGPNKHQRLIVGVRGSGKTHVLRVLHNRLWRNEELKKRLLVIYLLEDELGVASFLDFVVRLLRAIVRWYPEKEQLARDLADIYDLPAASQESRAVQLLLNETESKDALIIMENLGITFDDVKGFGVEGQAKLRDLVQAHPHFMIFASSQALAEGTREPDRPFYGFFKVIPLRRLSLEEAMTLLLAIASAQGQQDIVDFLNTPKGRGRVRVIYEFTGGNHRLLVTFYDFLTADSLAKLSELFIQALNPLKPYYQEQMRSLSAQQQKIIQYLSLQRTPCAVKEIARGCLAAPNSVSSQLKDLFEKNFVNRIEQQGRESYYEVTEALFRICYEADLEQEGAPIRLFVDFLANLYSAEELLMRQRGFDLLAHRFGNEGSISFGDEAEFYRKAISLCHPELISIGPGAPSADFEEPDRIHSFFAELQEAKAYREIVEFSKYFGEERDAFILHTEASAYARLGNAEKAKALALEALKKDPDDVNAHLLLADVLSAQSETTQEALVHARRAHELASEKPETLAMTGMVLGMAGNHVEALRIFQSLTHEHPEYSDGWRLMGQAFHNTGCPKEAEVAYRKALELDSNDQMALKSLYALVLGSGRYEEALSLCQRFNNVAPEEAISWALTGEAFERLGRVAEADAAYRKALELEPRNRAVVEALGVLVGNAGRHEEALNLFQRLTGIAPNYAGGWTLTGRALINLEKKEEAETAYRKALELNPRDEMALEWLGVLVYSAGHYEEALGLFHKLTDVAPSYARGWALMGKALASLKKQEEAETVYRKTLELNPRDEMSLEGLGALAYNAGRYEEALVLFQRLANAVPTHARAWALMGKALASLKKQEQAETVYRKALELNPRDEMSLEGLGTLAYNVGRYEEALVLFQRLANAVPTHARAWALMGKALNSLKKREEAETAYRKALELDPRDNLALEALGVLMEGRRLHQEALELFQKLNDTAPDYAHGWALTGKVLASLRIEEAEVAYRKALKLDSRDELALQWLGMLVFDKGRYEEALGLFEKLTTIRADDAIGWSLMGQALGKLKHTKQAEKAYRKALELDQDEGIALLSLGDLVHCLGLCDEALGFFQRLNTVAPTYAEGWKQTALALEHLGRQEDASKAFETALNLGTDRAELFNSRGEVRRTTGKYELALADYREALRANPKAIYPHFNIVSVHLATGEVESAIAWLPKALEADKQKDTPDGANVVQCFQENCQELFEHGPIHLFASYLPRALEIIETAGYIEQFKQSIPVTVFALLRNHRTIDEERFRHIIQAFEEILASRMDVSVAVRFLQIGVDFLKRKDRKALLKLTREERQTFCKELGIEDPGGE